MCVINYTKTIKLLPEDNYIIFGWVFAWWGCQGWSVTDGACGWLRGKSPLRHLVKLIQGIADVME